MGNNKMLVDFLGIEVNIINQRPCYTIIYHPINCENSFKGYESYSLYAVNEWIEEHFIIKSSVI